MATARHTATIQGADNYAMPSLTANDLRTRGVAAIEATLARQPAAVIAVRGKDRFVVMGVAHYRYLWECELDASLAQSRTDVAAGRYVVESAKQHVARLDALLAADALSATGAEQSARAKAPARKRATAKKAGRQRPGR